MLKKTLNISFIFLSAITVVVSFSYYKIVCSTGVCSYSTIKNILQPIEFGGMIMLGMFGVFLFVSDHIFKSWLKYIFSWGFPLSVYLTYITTGSSSLPAYGKVDVVRFWGMFFALASVLFIAGHLFHDWKKKKTVKK